jgi:hypothetical protein
MKNKTLAIIIDVILLGSWALNANNLLIFLGGVFIFPIGLGCCAIYFVGDYLDYLDEMYFNKWNKNGRK